MAQYDVWEREYRHPKLVTKAEDPQKDVLRFLKTLRRKHDVTFQRLSVLDLGCGTGRNSNYLATLGSKVVGYELSETALTLARTRALELGVDVTYEQRSMGELFPLADQSVDLVIDITSSNSLNEKERSVYLKEVYRVLKPGGYFFVKGLCKDGDQNAKNLIKRSSGPEKDTYVLQEMGLVERVFTREDLMTLYGEYFEIISLDKKTNYTRFNGQSYKRNFWLAFMQKPQ